MIVKAIKNAPNSILAKLIKENEFGLNLLSAAAKRGDKTAKIIWDNIGVYLGRGIINAVLLLNPEAVVLAGGVSRGAEYFRQNIRAALKKEFIKTPFKNLKLLVSRDHNIGAAGAALYALSKINEK
jgi:glucokinase